MADAKVRIEESLHSKMKELAGNKRGAIYEEYEIAIRKHIAEKTQENIQRDSGLEPFINKRIGRAEDHLASMLARNGMDTSMALMGIITLLEKLLKVDRVVIQNELRKQGYRYFATNIKTDKEKKANSKGTDENVTV